MKEPGKLLRWIGGMKLRKKLILSFFVLTLIPVAVLSGLVYRYMRSSMLERVEEGMASGMRQLQITADDTLRRYEQVLGSLMYNTQTINFFNDESLSYYDVYYQLREYYLPLLVTVREMNRDIGRISVYTDNSALRARGDEILPLADIRESEQAQAALRSRHVEWRMDGDRLTAMGMMMRLSHRSPENLVYIEFPAERLLDYDAGETKRWTLAVTDGGKALFYRNAGGFDRLLPPDSVESGIIRTDGEKLFTVSRKLESVPWTLRFVCPYEELHMNMRPLLSMLAAITLVFLAVIMLVSRMVTRSVTSRVGRLNGAMACVEHGTLTARPEVREWEKDEIAELTRHFDNMLDALNEYIEINYKNRITLQKAEMKMLQAQINPHFLYNTLSMINWMAVEHDELEISEVLMQLSQFYRMILEFSGGEVTVRDETENIMGYLDLQKRLHEDSFDAVLDVEEGLMDRRITGMVLQPIVENAISHGVDELQGRRGRIEVTGKPDGKDMVFTVRDNGPGMTEEQFRRSLSQASRGYGLKNVNDRLHIAYGSDYGLYMIPAAGEGTCIGMRIPGEGSSAGQEGESVS